VTWLQARQPTTRDWDHGGLRRGTLVASARVFALERANSPLGCWPACAWCEGPGSASACEARHHRTGFCLWPTRLVPCPAS
jgi:hypothetical protein